MSAIHICSNKLASTIKLTQSQCSIRCYCPSHKLGLVSTNGHTTGKDSGNWCTTKASLSHLSINTSNNRPQVSNIITEALFEEMFPYHIDHRNPARGFYTYEAFLAAAAHFPDFGSAATIEARKRELAAFFGQTSHETRYGGGGGYMWGYCYVREVNPQSDYVVKSEKWPASPGQQYYGRGPIQLTFNWNYGQAGEALGIDLLNNPDLVATDAVVSFRSAIWFWMTPQDNKPSCHDVMLGNWDPNETDFKANRAPGYGMCTNIINPGECGRGPDKRVASRIAFFKRYCEMLGVSPGGNLDCYDQCRF